MEVDEVALLERVWDKVEEEGEEEEKEEEEEVEEVEEFEKGEEGGRYPEVA